MAAILYFWLVTLKGKVIWLTGASSGIGEAIAHQLLEHEVKLIVSARRKDKLQKLVDQYGKEHVALVTLDQAQVDSLPGVVKEAEAQFGRVDIAILNGGISQRSLTRETGLEVDRRLMEVNFFANTVITKELLPGMLERGYGHFMVTSSLTGKFGFKLRSAYAASKHALHGFYESLRFEEHQNGIGVTMVCPGFIRTELSKTAVTGDGSAQGTMDNNQDQGMLPEVCAKKMIAALEGEKHEVVIGGGERYSVLLKRFFPKLHFNIVSKRSGR
ncbi:MAG: SDR family NAD(P)-dependent oxidoreductase [Flavobacteriales bacterium]|nr:SDR family NAD(P)-dependent oxidoreductase [Flavobacteriales bacterium]